MRPSDLVDRDPGETVVVNSKVDPYDVLIDRTTEFGNPFPITQDEDRATVLQKARLHFAHRFNHEPEFRAKVLALEGKVLGCHCKPLACHGDIFVDFIQQHKSTGGHVR